MVTNIRKAESLISPLSDLCGQFAEGRRLEKEIEARLGALV